MDWTCNGLFNDIDTVNADKFDSDRILVGEYGSEVISDLLTEGAVNIEANTEIVINNVIYDVLEVEETGKYIRIKKTEKSSQLLKENDELPDIPFKLANGDESSLNKHLVKGQFTLIDIWAHWCKGCILAVPTMKELLEMYPTKLNILALHHIETYGKEAQKCIIENEMTWTQGLTNPEVIKTLLSSGGYPYYVLIDPMGRVCKLNVQLSEIEDIIKKWKY